MIKEKQSGGMVGHFGRDKTIAIIREHYFWPQLSQDVKKFVQSYQVCETRLYDSGWYVVQGKSNVYSKEFNEGKYDQGEV